MKRLLISILMTVFFVDAQNGPFTLETLYDITNISDPKISPDGKRIAFVATSYSLEKGQSNADIYIMDKAGNNLRKMTNDPSNDYHPRWSSDGRYLFFISSRNNGTQAWHIPVFGGEAEQITNVSTGVANLHRLGEQNKIVFSSSVYPECGADDECNETISKGMQQGPVQAHMADNLLFRHWSAYRDGQRNHILLYNMQADTIVDLTPGSFDAPSLWGTLDVSPDGRFICYESKKVENPETSTNNDLFLLDLKTGKTQNITESNPAYDGKPKFSLDGRFIAYQTQTIPGYESDLKRLATHEIATGKQVVHTHNFDNWVQTFQWSPDGQFIYFIAHEQAHFPLYRLDIQSGQWQKILDLKTIDAYDISPDGQWLVATRRTVDQPTEIFRAGNAGSHENKTAVRLTHFNEALKKRIDFRPAEEMWIDSPTGRKIHTFIIKPYHFDPDKSYPLILNVHGGPQYQWYDGFRGDWQIYPGAGYVVAFANPHGSTGYGQAFTRAISKDWAGKVYDDIMAVTDELAELDYVDQDRMGAMGWSYGGYFMMWLEGHDPNNRFKALASMMGLYNLTSFYGATEELWFPEWDLGGTPWNSSLYEKWSPHRHVQNFDTPCLVIAGEKDYRVPYTQSLEFFTALQKQNVDSRLIIFKNDGHWPNFAQSMPLYYNAHLDWFHKYLGGKPAPYDMQKMLRNQLFNSPN
ncbi:MAG: prolyl oligopeptidase family serine peptidase [Caldithrix sp.]|nr:prolyl oligopeptidase family serine peptidase [Caldithrix sp.]